MKKNQVNDCHGSQYGGYFQEKKGGQRWGRGTQDMLAMPYLTFANLYT
jgi:hypothetical protein